MLTASPTDRPAFHTRSCTQHTSSSGTSTPHPDTAPQISQEPTTTPKPLTADCLDALLQMQKTDPFCKHISKRLLNGKTPHHKFETFTHVKGILYKHVMDTGKSSSPWSFQNLGSIQYMWKLMTNWVTKVIHAHIVS